MAEYLLGQEVDDKPVLSGELADEGAWRRMAAKRERRQVQPRRQSLGPCHQVGQVWLGELDVGHGMHERGRVSGREAQLVLPDLDHLAGRPQAGQREGRIGPRDEHDLGS